MYEIWVRIGDYGTPLPYTVMNKMTFSKNDPVIKECFNMYFNELKKNGLEIEEPALVIVIGDGEEKRIDITLQKDITTKV